MEGEPKRRAVKIVASEPTELGIFGVDPRTVRKDREGKIVATGYDGGDYVYDGELVIASLKSGLKKNQEAAFDEYISIAKRMKVYEEQNREGLCDERVYGVAIYEEGDQIRYNHRAYGYWKRKD